MLAESASTVMNGAMISLTPCFKASTDRPIQFSEYAEFKIVNDVIQQLNRILSTSAGFPLIPAPRKDSKHIQFPADKRNDQYMMRPEQECESLVYYSGQSRSMIDVLGLGQNPFWDDRVKAFYEWYSKSGSKTSPHGKAKTIISGLLQEMLPREIGAFQPLQQIVQIQMRRQCHGGILVI